MDIPFAMTLMILILLTLNTLDDNITLYSLALWKCKYENLLDAVLHTEDMACGMVCFKTVAIADRCTYSLPI